MAKRPYFKYGIDQLQSLFDGANKDQHLLKSLSHELEHRDRPKAKALLEKVQKELERLDSSYLRSSTEGTQLYPDQAVHRRIQSGLYPDTPASNSQVPDRLSVECAHCKTNNFVSTLDGVVQHLSCSNCKTSYEAVFKYGVMRTKFEEAKARSAPSSPVGWILLAVVVLLALAVIVK